MRSHWGEERGSVTAEFAAVIPAVMLVLALCLGGVQVAGQQIRLADAAADAARSLARGDGEGRSTARARQAVPNAALRVEHRGEFICARVSAPAPAPFGLLTVEATGCALAGGL